MNELSVLTSYLAYFLVYFLLIAVGIYNQTLGVYVPGIAIAGLIAVPLYFWLNSIWQGERIENSISSQTVTNRAKTYPPIGDTEKINQVPKGN